MMIIETFEEFVNRSTNESTGAGIDEYNKPVNEQTMTINVFSEGFVDFYDFINKYGKNMDRDTIKHIKEAIKHLDSAWENEADVHGVDYEQYKIKI